MGYRSRTPLPLKIVMSQRDTKPRDRQRLHLTQHVFAQSAPQSPRTTAVNPRTHMSPPTQTCQAMSVEV